MTRVQLGGHLGARVSALLDGQLPAEEAERAWIHVQECHTCRDQVERESWVKRRLAGLDGGAGSCGTPDALKGSLLGLTTGCPGRFDAVAPGLPAPGRPLRLLGTAALGGGAVGVAMLGVLALGTAPASAPTPTIERRAPVTQVSGPFAPARETSEDAQRALH